MGNKLRGDLPVTFEVATPTCKPRRSYDIVIALALLQKVRNPTAVAARLAARQSDMVVLRLPPAHAPTIIDSRSGNEPHHIGAVMKNGGFYLSTPATARARSVNGWATTGETRSRLVPSTKNSPPRTARTSPACRCCSTPRRSKAGEQVQAQTLLDYGCGRAMPTAAPQAAPPTRYPRPNVTLYDPAFRRDGILPAGKFDMVICSDVLEHVPEDEVDQLIERLFGVRSPGRLGVGLLPPGQEDLRRWHQHARGRSAPTSGGSASSPPTPRLRASPSCWWRPRNMGYGDWLMAAGEARLAHEKTGRPVLVTDPVGTPQWSDVFPAQPVHPAQAVRGRRLLCASSVPPATVPTSRPRCRSVDMEAVHADLGGRCVLHRRRARVRRAAPRQDHGRTRRQTDRSPEQVVAPRTVAGTGRHDSTTLRAVGPVIGTKGGWRAPKPFRPPPSAKHWRCCRSAVRW